MPINTNIPGDPQSIRTTAGWLSSQLQAQVHDCGTQVYKARTEAGGGWQGEASSGFQAKMTSAGTGVDGLGTDIGTLSKSFDDYADGLQTAQAGMARAKTIAQQGGLTINGDVIEDPGPAPAAPQALPTDGSATPQQASDHAAAVAAGQDHQTKVAAFNQAKEEADSANGTVNNIKKAARGIWDDLTDKKYLHASDFTNGIAGHVIDLQKDALKAKAASLEEQAAKFEDNYLNSPGGSDQAKLNEELRFNSMMDKSDVEGDLGDLAKIGSKIPVLGLAISAAGVGWDIAHGKPAGQAILSGAAGTAAAFGADAAVTAGIAASGFEATTAAGALLVAAGPVGVGIVVGVGVGLAADYAWNHWVPTNVKNDINNGVTAVGHGIANAASDVGHAIASIF